MAYEDDMARIAQEMHYGQAVPLLDKMRPQWRAALGGGSSMRGTPEFGFGAKNIGLQTGQMNTQGVNRVLGQMPVGGQQTEAIGRTIQGTGSVRAGSEGDLLAQVLGSRRAEPTGFATGAPGAAMAGLSGPAQNQILKAEQKKTQQQALYVAGGELLADVIFGSIMPGDK